MTQFKLTKKIFIIPGVIVALFFLVGISDYQLLPTAFIWFLILLLPKILVYATTSLELHQAKLIGKVGIIKTESLDAPLDKINSIFVKQGLIGKLMGYGSLIVSTSSFNFTFKYISKPNEVKSRILEEVEKQKERQQERQAELIAKAMKNS